MTEWHDIKFIDAGREPQVAPNPAYPEGKDIDATHGQLVRSCKVALPYPAPRCGAMAVRCRLCGLATAVTVAGRIDDPRSVRIACALQTGALGTHSDGTLRQQDEGDLRISISDLDENGYISFDFGKDVSWMSLPKDQVLDLCFGLLKKCGVPVEIQTEEKGHA